MQGIHVDTEIAGEERGEGLMVLLYATTTVSEANGLSPQYGIKFALLWKSQRGPGGEFQVVHALWWEVSAIFIQCLVAFDIQNLGNPRFGMSWR